MRNSRGFTLIELVIVIVILGILGAVAAPRFINMQGDAYEANVKALKGSIQSAMTLANTKAILNGYDSKDNIEVDEYTFEKEGDGLFFVYGFPAATADQKGIIAMLQDSGSFDGNDSAYIFEKDPTGLDVLVIAPRARGVEVGVVAEDEEVTPANSSKKCQVEYTQATEGKPASVKAFTEGC